MSELRRYSFDVSPRCTRCNKKLAERVTRPWRIACGRCKHDNYSEDTRVDKLVCIELDDGHGYITE